MLDSSPLFYPFKELFVLTSIVNGMSATVKVSSQVEACITNVNVLRQIDITFLFNKGFEIFPTADVILRRRNHRVAICRLVITLQEGVLHAIIHDEVHITLTVAKLGVVEGVIDIALGISLDDRQRLEALAEHGQLLSMDANLASLCSEHIALDADEVAKVEELLEERIGLSPTLSRGRGRKGCRGLYYNVNNLLSIVCITFCMS